MYRSILFLLTHLLIISQCCPNGWTKVGDNKCFQIVESSTRIDIVQRYLLCSSIGGVPATINNAFENSHARFLMADNDFLVFGLYQGQSGLKNMDGTPAIFTHFNKNPPISDYDYASVAIGKDGTWSFYERISSDPILCQTYTVPVNGCPQGFVSGKTDAISKNCYMAGYDMDWSDAQKECIKKNSSLAVVKSDEENAFVADLVQVHESEKDNQETWLGGYAVGEEFVWADMQSFNYDRTSQNANVTGCLAMASDPESQYDYSVGDWFGEDCSVKMRSFVCKIENF